MTITIIGHGYVGLVTASVFANFGNTVYVIGRNQDKINKLKSGDSIIYEPGLEELLEKNLKAGRLKFTLNYDPAIKNSQIVFIAVGTPSGDNGQADLSAVFAVAEKVAKNLDDKYRVVACKSTVPVGTNLKIKNIIQKSRRNFDIASCPEFLREGTGISDTLHPDRVVIGCENQKAADLLLELHQPINGKRVITDLASAELIKYAANSILATKISFANLISFYCEKTGANVEEVLRAVGLDKRVGDQFLNPGIGFGGACFPKDVQALIYTGKDLSVDTGLLDSVQNINFLAKQNFVNKIIKNFKGQKIAIWGLSFKPNTDDIREAPSIFIIEKLLKNNLEINVYDPEAQDNIKQIFSAKGRPASGWKNKLNYFDDPYSCAKDADGLVINTEWPEFKQIDLAKIKKSLSKPLIFDGRNIYDLAKMKELGFKYYSVGRKAV